MIHKNKTKYIWIPVMLILVVVLIFVLILASGFAGYSYIADAPQFYTAQELKQMLNDHKQEMEEGATIVLKNENLRKHMREVERDNDVNVYVKNDKKFFTEEEWNKIEVLFKELQLLAIYRLGDTTIEFQFPMSDDGINNTLCYSTDSSDIADDVYTRLYSNWWLTETQIIV